MPRLEHCWACGGLETGKENHTGSPGLAGSPWGRGQHAPTRRREGTRADMTLATELAMRLGAPRGTGDA